MLWIVPARIAGTWRTPKGPLVIKQKFQSFAGTLGDAAVENGRIRGEEITFTVGSTTYTGRVDDDYRMRLSSTGGGKPVEWTLQPAPRR
jgi:hypothetical protein